MAVPGFVDWQVNGFGGVHFGDAEPDGYRRAAESLARVGIVWAAPTLLSMDVDGYVAALEVLRSVRRADPGSGFTGAHIEGPYLSPRWAGAHDPTTFVDGALDPECPDATLDRLLAAGPPAMLTLAPEVPGVRKLLRRLRSAGVTVSIGHSDATAEGCRAAAIDGADAITHCWNGHRRLTARDPGPAGWALSTPGVRVGLIADGIHVDPGVLALSFAAARGRVALTTDAIAPAGTDATCWVLGGREVTIDGGAARLTDGTLAGSVATPSRMLRVLTTAGVPLAEAVHGLCGPQSASLRLGEWRLRPGDPAHVTVLDDDSSVLQAWRSGTRVA